MVAMMFSNIAMYVPAAFASYVYSYRAGFWIELSVSIANIHKFIHDVEQPIKMLYCSLHNSLKVGLHMV